tara:strand:+ start:6539 stop:8344 length:1806 start_codon:yes stop_codon:yes gene_type:complete
MEERYQMGSITSGYRVIRPGEEYDKYFPKPQAQDRIIIEDGEVGDTVDLMKRVVWKYIEDTKGIAPLLKGKTLNETCENTWNFLYHHIQYKLDERGLEQLRRPARSWSDRKSGIDCDCFSIFTSSILTNLHIPHSFRITKYGGTHFQHVYVVVPNRSETLVIDPVLSNYNYEKPYSEHKDFAMNLSGIDVAVLSGPGNDNLHEVLLGMPELGDLGEVPSDKQMDAMYNYLVATRNAVAANPKTISHIEDPQAFLKMLDYAITYWYTDKRDEALDVLARNEEKLNFQNGFNSLEGDDYWQDDYLGRVKRGFFRRVGDVVKNVGTGAKSTATQVAKAVIRYNPLSVTARLGFLAAMKLNLKGMGSKLKWAYASQQQAAAKGFSAQQWQRSKQALSKIESLYADKLQGKRDALRDAILKGKAGGLSGAVEPDAHDLGSLGEPVTIGASIAAATPLIIAAVKILKDAGLFTEGEDVSTNNLEAEAASTQARSGGAPAQMNIPTQASPMVQSSVPYMSEQSMTPAAMSTSGQAKGIMAFVKKNPAVAAIGAGAIALGAYMMLGPKKKTRASGLSGTRKTTRRTTRKTSSAARSRSRRSSIPKLNLK